MTLGPLYILMIVGTFSMVLVVNYLYYRLTTRKSQIHIVQKYSNKINNKTVYMIMDTKSRSYIVGPCFWKVCHEYSKLWDRMKEGYTYDVILTGPNMPMMNMFPNIIEIV